MGAALGLILGAGMGALGKYAQDKTDQNQQHDQLLFQMYAQHPEAASDPQAQKFLKKHLGPEGAELFGHISKLSQQASSQFGQAFGSGGSGTQPSMSPGTQVAMTGKGGPGMAPQPQAQQADPLSAMQQRISRMEAYMASPAFSNLRPDQQKVATDIYNRTVQEMTRLTSIQNEQMRSSPEAASKRKQAELDVENAPGNVRAEANRAAQKKTAEAKAALDVAGSPEAMDVTRRKHDITAGGKAASEATERKKRVDIVTALGKQYDTNHPYARAPLIGSPAKDRDAYIRAGLGGVDPQAYIQGAGASTSADPTKTLIDKY